MTWSKTIWQGDQPSKNTGTRTFLSFAIAGRMLLLAFAILAFTAGSGGAAPPNIVLIVADDLGYNDVGFNGGTQIKTPNIDALAKEGVVLTAGYSASSVCSPSRAGLMTGRYPQRFGHENNQPPGYTLGLPLTEITMADVLRSAGYATGVIGKWHLGGAASYQPNRRGFDYFYGFLPASSSYLPPVTLRRNTTSVQETRYVTTAFGSEAAAFINRNRSRPFFLYAAFNAPHVPLQAPQGYLDKYSTITDPKRRTYAAMVAALDDAIGEISKALKRNGVDRNTLLFFLSDNGGATWAGANNAPLREGKSTVYEGGVRVPMFVRWPSALSPGTYTQPVMALDIMPTAAAAAGAVVPHELDGVDLLPYLQGDDTSSPHRSLFWRSMSGTPEEQSGARVGAMKLDVIKGASALFNLSVDIGEKKKINNPSLLGQIQDEYEIWESQMMPPRW